MVNDKEPTKQSIAGELYFQNIDGRLWMWIGLGGSWNPPVNTHLPATEVNAQLYSVMISAPLDITENELAAAVRRSARST